MEQRRGHYTVFDMLANRVFVSFIHAGGDFNLYRYVANRPLLNTAKVGQFSAGWFRRPILAGKFIYPALAITTTERQAGHLKSHL